MKTSFFKTVLLTGLLVGTTDLLLAILVQYIQTGSYPERMLLFIAGGGMGLDKSLSGGVGTEFIGLLFHFIISISFTLLFFILYPKIKNWVTNIYFTGILYAVFVNLTMTFIVLPLTPLPEGNFILIRAFLDWVLFGIVFGIPIVYFAKQYFAKEGNRL